MRRRYGNMQKEGYRYLEQKEILNPLLVIAAFFDTDNLEVFRQELRLLFSLSCSDVAYRKRKPHDASRLMSIHREATRLIEAAYLLKEADDVCLEIAGAYPADQVQDDGNMGLIAVDLRLSDELMRHCRLLRSREIDNVKLVFKDLFDFLKLSEWQDEMDMLLFYSLNNTPVAQECDNSQLYFPMHELLEKLLECAYVILVHKIQQDKTFSSFTPSDRGIKKWSEGGMGNLLSEEMVIYMN